MQVHKLTPLFCKPPIDQDKSTILYSRFCPEINSTIQFRSLDIDHDLKLIFDWVNMDYTTKYWQLNGQFSSLYAIYQCMELNPYSHSFIGLLNGEIICQFDVYSVMADELKNHVNAESNDCGFHLLMSPNNSPVKNLSKTIVQCFLQHYFSFPKAKRMYAEPDVTNSKSIILLEKCGFKWVKNVEMSYKRADIYMTEEAF